MAEIEEPQVTHGSGNVFADLGLPNPEERLYKSQLVVAIQEAMADRKLNQSETAKLVGVSQPDLSKLLRGLTTSFTVDRLYQMLTLLGADVEITIVRHQGAFTQKGQITVKEAIAS